MSGARVQVARGIVRVASATAAAVATVLIGLRLNPPPSYEPDPPVHPVLHEMIDDVRVDVSSLRRAVASIRAVTRTPIRFERESLEAAGPSDNPNVARPGANALPSTAVRIRGQRLGTVVATALREVAGPYGDAAFDVDDAGAIVVYSRTYSGPRADDRHFRVYAVGDLAADCLRWRHPRVLPRSNESDVDGMAAFLDLIGERVETLAWDGAPRGKIGRWGDRLWVDAPASVQWDVQRLLFLLRNPARGQ